MADEKGKPKTDAKAERKPRGPVRYIAFGEITPGWWALMAADREAANVYTLRKELRGELGDIQAAAGLQVTDETQLVIIPADQAHVVSAVREMAVTEKFKKTALRRIDPPLASMLTGPDTEASIAARMGAGADATPGVVAPDAPPLADGAAQAAERALAAARRVDPSAGADAPRQVQAPARPVNPDIDPETGVSRRPASAARPEDEGTTVFPLGDGDE